MGQRISKLGSMKRKELFENWKHGHDLVWQVQVNTVMVNKELIKNKRKNEALLAAETTKCHKLEEQLQTQAMLNEKENQLASTQAKLKSVTESNDLLRVISDWQLLQRTRPTPRSEGSCHLYHVNNSGYKRNRYTLIFVNRFHSWRVRKYVLCP